METYELDQLFKRQYLIRRLKSKVIVSLCFLAAIIALWPLVSVLYYVSSRALPHLALSFFTHLPSPVGETGGGMGNSFIGSIILIVVGSIIGIPWGLATGIYLSEYGQNRLGFIIRFVADMLTSVPSIVIGLFVSLLASLCFLKWLGLPRNC